nr:MAG TPA: hypothetical protein [Caudoviricetes sp.]
MKRCELVLQYSHRSATCIVCSTGSIKIGC